MAGEASGSLRRRRLLNSLGVIVRRRGFGPHASRAALRGNKRASRTKDQLMKWMNGSVLRVRSTLSLVILGMGGYGAPLDHLLSHLFRPRYLP